jgi:hypothetical protein
LQAAVPDAGAWVPGGTSLERAFLTSVREEHDPRRWWVLHVGPGSWKSVVEAPPAGSRVFVRVSSQGTGGGIFVDGDDRVFLQLLRVSGEADWTTLAPALDRVAALPKRVDATVRDALGAAAAEFERPRRGAGGGEAVLGSILAALDEGIAAADEQRVLQLLDEWRTGPRVEVARAAGLRGGALAHALRALDVAADRIEAPPDGPDGDASATTHALREAILLVLAAL